MVSATRLAELKSGIDTALASRRLDGWQTRFARDIRQRLDRDGPRVRLSDRQIGKLDEILGAANRRARILPFQRPKRRRRYRPRIVNGVAIGLAAALTVVVGVAIGLPGLQNLAPSQSAVEAGFTVVDGDTVRVNGERTGTRLVGFNTPETWRARCARERQLGQMATTRLEQLVASGRTELYKVACACRPGTEGTRLCNYGRSCGILRVDGRDVGAILVSEGLAVPYLCGASRCPPTPRPWCG